MWKSRLFTAVKLLLSALLLYWLVTTGRLDLTQVARMRWGTMMLAVIAARLAGQVSEAVRWYLLCRAVRLRVGIFQSVHISFIGGFLSLATPGLIGADASRVYYAGRWNPERKPEVVSSIAVDRLTGAVTLIAMALLFSGSILAGWLISAVAFLAGVGVLIYLLRRRLRTIKPVAAALEAVAEYWKRPYILAVAVSISFLGHLTTITGAYFAFPVLGLSAPAETVAAVQLVVAVSQMLPITPMGLGVMEGLSSGIYRMFGVRGGAEVSIVLRVAMLVSAVLGGVAFLIPVRDARGARFREVCRAGQDCVQQPAAA